jgi:hypothetical protein
VIPSEHFNTIAYAGNGTDGRELSVGFQPDFVWVKNRSHDDGHVLFDVVRTLSNGNSSLTSNTTAAENTGSNVYGRVDSFTTTGYTVEEGSAASGNGLTQVNQSSKTYVAWNWKANGSGVSNTSGTITSTVSVNADAGFSIVKYTGNGVEGATVGHGLSKKPEMMIVKSRSLTGEGWLVYNEDMGATKYAYMNSTAAFGTYPYAWDDTEPTSSVFSIHSNTVVNGSGATYIGYIFHSVDGYSKVGSYTGNGSSDGTFVYTGFRVAYILIKKTAAAAWPIIDDKRENKAVFAHSSQAEQTHNVDLLSNGFKLRTTDGNFNSNGGTFIYLAFAESPFKHTNAR